MNTYKCANQWYYEFQIGKRIITLNPRMNRRTIKPTNVEINVLNCDYGIRMEPQKYYETLVVNKCYNSMPINGIKSMHHIYVYGSLMNRYYTDESCIGNMTQQELTPGNIKAYCNNNTVNECDYVLLRQCNKCNVLDTFRTISYIVNVFSEHDKNRINIYNPNGGGCY